MKILTKRRIYKGGNIIFKLLLFIPEFLLDGLFIFKDIYVDVFETTKPLFCSHNWMYWDANFITLPGSHITGFKENDHFRKCKKCSKQQSGNMMPAFNGYKEKAWDANFRELPMDTTIIDVEIYTTNELHEIRRGKEHRKRKLDSLIKNNK